MTERLRRAGIGGPAHHRRKNRFAGRIHGVAVSVESEDSCSRYAIGTAVSHFWQSPLSSDGLHSVSATVLTFLSIQRTNASFCSRWNLQMSSGLMNVNPFLSCHDDLAFMTHAFTSSLSLKRSRVGE